MTRANRSGALELLEVASTQHVVGDRAGRGPVPAALRAALGSDGRRGHVVAVVRGHYPRPAAVSSFRTSATRGCGTWAYTPVRRKLPILLTGSRPLSCWSVEPSKAVADSSRSGIVQSDHPASGADRDSTGEGE